MPIYEYECQNCHTHLEIVQKMKDDPIKKCEECGENQLKKLVSLSSFSLKGSGWFASEYKKSAPSPTEKKEAKDQKSAKTDEIKPSKNSEKTKSPQNKTTPSSEKTKKQGN